ncbi:amino acid adenylation domain-containing protein [Streptacidiphilus sp. MAP12-16]|uniref:amino acid adenylation domain-containing protein n=1 Tax=Streptacidiphilus sp. MAP12-16 TaxID=3156300 RepID=UPI0035148478
MTGYGDVVRAAPVSGLQRGLWFLDRWNPEAATYNIPWILQFDGDLDLRQLQEALELVVQRHDSLRTTFALRDGGPVQLVHDRLTLRMAVLDLRDFAEPERDKTTETLIATEAGWPFDLESGPLLRVSAIRRSDREVTVVLVVHHIVWDGWSADAFEHEWSETYSALVDGRAPAVPELTAQYTDYVQEQLDGSLEEHLSYWKGQLAEATPLELPSDRPRPPVQSYRGATEPFGLAPGTAARVRKLAEAQGVTPFIVTLSAFSLLLSRYTGAEDMVIGTPATTRNRPELENLIGYFVNLLPLRIRLRPTMTFLDLLEHVQEVAFDAYAYVEAPLDTIIDSLGLDRSTQHHPLVQVVFGAHAEDHRPMRFGTAVATRGVRANGTAKFDLTWSVYDSGELRGEVEFSSDLFDTASVLRMIQEWRTLLDAALDDSSQSVRRLTSPAAMQPAVGMLLQSQDRCLHRLFEDAVDRHGERTAVSFGRAELTYTELDQRANQLARALTASGVGHGDRVGLLLERTPDVLVSILAVLKAGASYVPVDPAAPAGRAKLVFADTGTVLVVTDQPEAVPEGPWQRFHLEERATFVAAMSPSRPQHPVRSDDIAYVIFTSGSTGRPKGVAVAHEHVSRLMAAGAERFEFGPDEVWTFYHSYAFDWTVWEIWGALHHGSKLVVVPYLTSRSPEDFAELLEREGVSFLCLTPSALRQLEKVLRQIPRSLPRLKQIMLGGEALDPAVVSRWIQLDRLPSARLCNLYGITETTVHVTTFDVPGTEGGFQRSLIGEAMSHLGVKVLDTWLRPCPVGTPGELYVYGGSLAYGYWGRPGLTAGRFVADTDSQIPGSRMYRTGDVARRLEDGGLEYLGRADHQVKLRGFRIELGEIENALSAHPTVSACVVTVHDDRLAAYVTGAAPERTREFLANSLPDYMIPASVTVLDALPLTVNGKIDRAALPVPDLPSSQGGAQEPPQTPAEELFARVWSRVLGVTGIGVTDNFFHLGGDSIRAVELVGGLREAGWKVALRDVFDAPTITGLIALARPAEPAEPEAAAHELRPPLSPEDRAALPPGVVDAYSMAAMQLSMVYHMELSGQTAHYHNVNSYRIAGCLNEVAFMQAVAEAIDRHPLLRTGLEVSGYSEPLQLVYASVPLPIEFEDLRGSDAQDMAVRDAFEYHRQRSFEPSQAPLFRITVQWLDANTFQLTVSEHHAILDGWSFTSLLTELLQRHAELSADPFSKAPPAPRSSFREFVAVEQEAASDPQSLAFWRDRLANVSGDLWPGTADVHDVPVTTDRVLPEAPEQLRLASAAAGVPVKSVALAAHMRALHHVTGRRRITTGLATNGRLERPGGTEVYGLFVNSLPLVCQPAQMEPLELARAVHQAELEMMPHRRVPFAQLARLMADSRLDSQFGYLSFHALGRLRSARILDSKIGCEPTLRHEPNSFSFTAALIQDSATQRVLLAVDYQRSLVPDEVATAYLEAYETALDEMAAQSTR